ncbi:nicotinate-nucleotide--dimethylbenzimidazole phosphoribosyltransferase [Streptomyces marokkonensis]|uniref:nicotinate-nucleotide--dimethylbenzimidazole phosphoribosyltransferase n=1 Tax=Streptomyces marokkonensis TaxID=324855 RepID=UPI0011F1A081|nr:nicotinate-nucleotide--dimethylbenzimidazole phosphoribosyltransferase [Streptomyces marokkonensis]
MTDTGQVPGEGLPENAGMVEQPGVPAPDAYTYLSDSPAEDEDLLLPGAQGAWGNEIAPPVPEPVVETVHEPGPHEMAGRDSGSVDLGGVRLPDPAQPRTAPAAPRRPLHLGPPIPDVSASPVRSLADRGPADLPARQAGPPTLGPEYLDVPRAREAAAPQAAAPWGAQATVSAGAPAAETVVPPTEPLDAAQAVVTRVATAAVAAQDTEGAGVAGAEPVARYAQAEAASAAVPEHVLAGERSEPVQAAPEPVSVSVPSAEASTDGPVPASAGGSEGPQAAEAPGTGAAAPEYVPEPEAAPAEAPGAVPDASEHLQAAEAQGTGQVTEPVADATAPAEAPRAAEVPGDAVPTPGAEARVPGDVLVTPGVEAGVPGDVLVTPGVEAGVPGDVLPTPAAEAGEPETAQVSEETAAAQAPGAETAAVAEHAAQEPEAHQAVAEPGTAPVTEEPPADRAPGAENTVPDDTQVPQHPQAPEAPQAVEAPGAPDAAPEHPRADDMPQAPVAVDAPAPDTTVPQPAHVPPAGASALPEAPVTGPDAAPPVAAGPAPAADPAPEPAAGPDAAPATPEPVGTAQAPGTAADDAVAGPSTEAPASHAPTAHGQDAPHVPDGATAAGTTPPPAPAGDATPVQGPQQTPATPVPGTVPLAPGPDQPLGRFVPVDGTVPTAPQLAPTPPQGVAVPADGPHEAGADAVPATPDPELAQDPDDLDTRGAGVEPEEARSAGPAAPGYDDAEREAVLKVMRERRDIRNGFRSDPIPHEVLLRVLEAAHTAPSVGHSQPWDFVVIRSAETRRAMHELAMRQRDAYAKSLPKGRAKQFKEMKIEAILDTPVNIVVTADPTRGGRHTLGRHTQPQMAPYSSALAVENLWLAARAEGLGVGWVSFFDEREMVRALELPEHLEVVAYLCVGYVDEFPAEPELMQAGWSKRRPLSWVVHEETYGRRALPGEDPHDLLAETVAQIRPLDAKALGEAWERQKRMTKPAGALGMLEIISAQLSGLSRQCPPPVPEPAAVAIFAGDHGVHAQGVTPWPQEVTAQMVANFLGGGAVCNAFAAQVGAEVCVVDVGVSSDLPATPGLLPRKIRAGTSDMTTGPAMTREEAKQAIEVGIETARDLVAAGNKALLTGEMGIANTTASAALISVFTGADPAEVTGRGTGINDETLARKTEVVRRALELHQPDPADPLGVLAAIGGFEHAAMVGLLLGGASLRTPVILDGVSAGAAALVARAIAPEVLAACIAGHRSAEPGHVAALNKLGLRPLVDLDLRLGEGTGALLALPLVQSTARAMHEVATFDSAGVTEK